MAQRTARFDISSLPESQAQAASRIMERVPRAQQEYALNIIARIHERYGENAGDALAHLESIVRSGNFRASYLGTVSLILDRSGPNSAAALREFSMIIDHEKFNSYVNETVRLAATRAGENAHEALRALHFLLSNPSFTQRSLNLGLPDTFVLFLDQAIRGAGDADYMGIRALSSLSANPEFGPAQFNPRFARAFGAYVRTVREQSAPNQLNALESLGTLLGNGAVRPQDITPEIIQSLIRVVNLTIEQTRAAAGPREIGGGALTSIDEAMRTLNLALGNRSFRLEMIAEGGILRRVIESAAMNEQEALSAFLRFMRASRQHPQAIQAAGSLMSAGRDPMAVLFTLDALLSNPSLAGLVEREDFVARFGALLSIQSGNIAGNLRSSDSPAASLTRALSRTLRSFDPTVYCRDLPPQLRDSPATGLLALLLADQRMTPEIMDRVMTTLSSLGPKADIAVLCLAQLLNSPSFRPGMLDQAFLDNLSSLANEAAASAFDFRALSGLFMLRGFRPSLIAPDGLIPLIIRTRSTEAEGIFRLIAGIAGRRPLTPELETLIREAASVRGAYGRLALDALGLIMQNAQVTQDTYPILIQIVRSMGDYSEASLLLYNSILSNPNLRPMLADQAFTASLCALLRRVADASGGHARDAIASLALAMQHQSFGPEMMGQIDRILERAGASSRFVFGYLQSLQTTEGVGFSRAMQPGFLDFLCRMGSFITRYGGADPARAHSAFSSLMGEMKADVFALQDRADEIFAYLDAAAGSAGEMSSLVIRAMLPRVHNIPLDEDDARFLGAWIGGFMRDLPDNAQREAAIDGVANMLTAISRNSGLHDILFENPALYARGRDLAESLITDRPISPEVMLNFANGIQRIGEERVRIIYQRFGLRHFARYSDSMLEQLYLNRERPADPSRPTVFVTFPHWDHNGAFYREGRTLDDLLGTHNVVIFEAGTEQEFYQAANDFRMRYGRTRDIIIGGHGQPSAIRLGSDMEAGMLDVTDADELRALRDVLGQGPRMVLVSCSTGADSQAIGAMISRIVGAALFAPREPTGVKRYGVDSQGRITVEFRSERGFFFQGIDVGGRR